MPSLLDRMKASAAERLKLPDGRRPSEEAPRYRNFLKVESHRLKIMHRGGGSGREVCAARAAMLDVLLTNVLDSIRASTPPGQFPD